MLRDGNSDLILIFHRLHKTAFGIVLSGGAFNGGQQNFSPADLHQQPASPVPYLASLLTGRLSSALALLERNSAGESAPDRHRLVPHPYRNRAVLRRRDTVDHL